jgi:tetratricopeptide (TPR) repeat protein
MQNMTALRNAYNIRKRDVPDLGGKITVKFAIEEFGNVLLAQVVETTVNDSTLEAQVLEKVMQFKFETIDKPGDVTEVTYPFIFSNDEGFEAKKAVASKARAVNARDDVIQKIREQTRAREEKIREEERAMALRQSRGGVTLYGAMTAAANLKRWWNFDFAAPGQSKYPAPDSRNGLFNRPSKDISKNPDYLQKMTRKPADDYQIYLKTRSGYAASPTFYFDMANWFYALGDKEAALRILTSIADLELENASLYRLLGYRFKEYGEYNLAKFVCRKVVEWRPMEPQSYRDYSLALADNGEPQAALDSLYVMLSKHYSSDIVSRTRGIEEVIVTEINNLITKNPRLNTSKIDKDLIVNIPVDIRVVINWNMDNTDIDLHVTDPAGEECSYSNVATRIGGRISADITSGYGPEQFLLKKAVPGKYQIYVNYYGDSQFTDAGPSTVMAEIYTKYGDKAEQRQVVCLQLTGDGKALVAEFKF